MLQQKIEFCYLRNIHSRTKVPAITFLVFDKKQLLSVTEEFLKINIFSQFHVINTTVFRSLCINYSYNIIIHGISLKKPSACFMKKPLDT